MVHLLIVFFRLFSSLIQCSLDSFFYKNGFLGRRMMNECIEKCLNGFRKYGSSSGLRLVILLEHKDAR